MVGPEAQGNGLKVLLGQEELVHLFLRKTAEEALSRGMESPDATGLLK